jgi:hypothetical protein
VDETSFWPSWLRLLLVSVVAYLLWVVFELTTL